MDGTPPMRPIVLIVGKLLVSCLLCATPARGAEEVFSGCKATAVSREGWKAVCESAWLLSIADGPRSTPPKLLIDGIETGLRAATRGTVQRGPAAVVLPGGGWTVVKFEVKDAQEPGPGFALFAFADRPAGRRFLSCMGTTENEARCARALELIAGTPWRSGPPVSLARDTSAPKIAGRAYIVPDGCEVSTQPNASVVACSDQPVMFWAQPPNDIDVIENFIVANLPEEGLKESAAVPCSVQGSLAKCRLFKTIHTGDRRAAYFVRTTVRSQPLAILCLTKDSSRALPAACASVLSLESTKG